MDRRITRSAALFATLAIIVGACSPAAQSSASAAAPSAAAPSAAAPSAAGSAADNRKVELTFTLWGYDGDIKTAYDEFIAAYLKKEPRVTKVNVGQTPFVRYHDVMNVNLAGGKPPDVAHIAYNLAPVYIDAGQLLDLKPTLSALSDYQFDDLRPSALTPWSKDGKIYGIPFTNATNVMYYNKDIFAKAGLKDPDQMVKDGEWTWANLQAAAKQIVDSKSARYGMVFGNAIFSNGWRILEDIYAPYGAGPWSADGKTCTFNSPETKTATQLVWDMIYKDKSHPEPGVDVDWFAGDIGMGLYRPSQAFRTEGATFQWGVAPQPSGPKGYVPSDATNGISVFKDSPNADLAAEFLAFTTNVENAKRMGANFPSARLSLQKADVLAQYNKFLTQEDIQQTVVDAISNEGASWGYNHLNWGPLFSNAQRVFDGSIWKPDADVSKALDQVCTDISGLLG